MSPTIIVFDTETTGFPERAGFDKNYPPWAIAHYAKCRMVQLAYQIYEIKRGRRLTLIGSKMMYVKPDGFAVPIESTNVHGFTTEFLVENGRPIREVLAEFEKDLQGCVLLVGHNVEFDKNVVGSEAYRTGLGEFAGNFNTSTFVCTMRSSKLFCSAVNDKGQVKFPRLSELYMKIYGKEPENQHDALGDVKATAACYIHLRELGLVI